ncbi:unnamed protein product [Calypogeia fissa]
MASDHSDVIQVKPEELYDQSEGGFVGAPVSKIEDVEEATPTEEQKDFLQKHEEAQQTAAEEQSEQSEPVVHETDKLKTTYNTEEDSPDLSLKSKIKDKMAKLGDKLRPKDAVEAKNADPHPNVM